MSDKLKKAEEEEDTAQDEQEDAAEEQGKKKGEDEGSEEDEKEDEEEMGKCGMKKATGTTSKSEDLTEDDLQKSIDQLQALTEDKGVSRKQQLLEKALGSELSKSERAELHELLGKSEKPKATRGEQIAKGLTENDTLQKALDVSDFLQEQHTELVKALTTLADAQEKSDARQHEFNLVLARAVAGIGQLTKSLGERVGVIESQPARGPKSRGVTGAQALSKSFAGGPQATDQQLSKAQVLDELETMVQESMSKSLGGMTEDGLDLITASSKYEQFNLISQGLLDQVHKRIQEKRAAAR